jgi:hypothetical protein
MDLPEEIVIYGIEVQEIMTFGEVCTEQVAASIPRIVETIIRNEELEAGSTRPGV